MYDFYDEPEGLRRAMRFLRDGTEQLLIQAERMNLLSLNNGPNYVASGGIGWTGELPKAGYKEGRIRLTDMWGFAESQETSLVGPEMFHEFIYPYQKPLLAYFGLNGYGCCEALNARWESVKQFPNLRRVSVAPWSDFGDMAEKLGDRYIYSLKPNPATLALRQMDEDFIRASLREQLRLTRGCRLEIIMKDVQTVQNNINHVKRWCHIAREEVERL